jgi:hypothetical protein
VVDDDLSDELRFECALSVDRPGDHPGVRPKIAPRRAHHSPAAVPRSSLWRLDARLPRDRRADFRGRAILFHDRPDGRGFDGIDDKVGESGDGVAIPEGCDAGA